MGAGQGGGGFCLGIWLAYMEKWRSSLSAFVITNVMRILLHSEAALPSPVTMDHEPE